MAGHNFLVIGGGGREHALAWKLAQSPLTDQVYCCPGNGGTAKDGSHKLNNIGIDWCNFAALDRFIREHKIVATLIGPEAPLVGGLGDYLRSKKHYCFGPNAEGAQLEGSKSFCKSFFERHKVPTAAYQEFTSYAAAEDYLKHTSFPTVIKFDGLAGGKGVTVAESLESALGALTDIYKNYKFGKPAEGGKHKVVIEEFLVGEEVSCMIAVQGTEFKMLQTSRDHKPRDDGNKGPNTGGMGAYTPAVLQAAEVAAAGPAAQAPLAPSAPLSKELIADIEDKIVVPTIEGLAADGIDYCGFLYAGLMIHSGQAKILEYNCRLGDPETEPLMFALESDFAEFMLNCRGGGDGGGYRDAAGFLKNADMSWHPGCSLSVIMASGGYPDAYATGKVITGLDDAVGEDVKVFHCGTKADGDNVITTGGRVLAVTARGKDLDAAYNLAYENVSKINWDNCYYRKDIGKI